MFIATNYSYSLFVLEELINSLQCRNGPSLNECGNNVNFVASGIASKSHGKLWFHSSETEKFWAIQGFNHKLVLEPHFNVLLPKTYSSCQALALEPSMIFQPPCSLSQFLLA